MAVLRRPLQSLDWFRVCSRPAGMVALALLACLAPAQPLADEYRIKALFLYNFAKFIEWPGALGSGPICVGIIGDDPFGDLLDQAVQGKTINGRGFVVRRLRAEQARACHIVFVSASEQRRLRSLLGTLRGAGVLTVGETPGFAEMGGVLNFEIAGNKVRFEINPAAADRAGLKISSKLLSLAKIVHDEGQ